MAKKTLKPYTTRKPPEPAAGHEGIEAWMQRGVPGLHPLVTAIDDLIRKTIPGLQFAIKWQKAYYGTPKLGWIIELVAYQVSANVVFLAGADFDSPPPLGDTDRSRYVKVTTLEEVQGPEMRRWIKQAGRVPGWK